MKTLFLLASLATFLGLASAQAGCSVNYCDSCENKGPVCSNCPTGTVLQDDNKACLDCPDGCASCKNADANTLECLTCKPEYYLKDTACIKCQDNCIDCALNNTDVICSTCKSGYVLTENECKACDSNCRTCIVKSDGSTNCNACDDGYFKVLSKGSCKKCPSFAKSCVDDGQGTAKITDCVTGYDVFVDAAETSPDQSGKECVRCPSECTKCSGKKSGSVGECTECKVDRYLDGTVCRPCGGDDLTTNPKKERCLKCDGAKCETCKAEYYVDATGTCTACPSNCNECSIENGDLVCSTCKNNYGLRTTTSSQPCDTCPTPCLECTIETSGNKICTKCPDRYAIVAGQCSACSSNCDKCSESSGNVVCSTCDSGFKIDSGACVACPANCKKCDTAAADKCDDDGCEDKYGIDANKDCKSCAPNCKKCATRGAAKCDDGECDAKYALIVDVCEACSANCGECTVKGECDTTKCEDGYGLEGGKACVACTANCKKCEGAADSCDADGCDETFGLNGGTTTCVACPPNCKECDLAADKCDDKKCVDGYRFDSDLCANACPANCKKCDTAAAGKCDDDGCNAKYAKDATSGLCVACPSKCNVCTVASGKTQCTSGMCEAGYGGINCDACSAGCAECADATKCTNCKPKYVLETDSCKACPDKCSDCEIKDGSPACKDTKCDAGHAGINCDACPENCDKCDHATPAKCTDCKTGFTIDASDQCTKCPPFCKECTVKDGEVTCDTCVDKYAKNPNECTDCSANCKTCEYSEGATECKTCMDQYVLKDKKCEKCPTNCKECGSDLKCNPGKCATGFARNDAKECTPCGSLTFANCKSCTDHPGGNGTAECLSCNTGYTLKDGLKSGKGAECVDTSALACPATNRKDPPAGCLAGKCTDKTYLDSNFQCARNCYVCGDVTKNEYVDTKNCKVDNSTGVVKSCPSGHCLSLFKKENNVWKVIGGCASLTEVKCGEEIPEANGVTKKCCKDTDLCNDDLDKPPSKAGAMASSLLLILLLQAWLNM